MSGPLNLNIETADVDTSMPRAAEGRYLVNLTKADIVQKKDDPSKHNIEVHFTTVEPIEDTNGNILNPGYTFRRYLPLQQSDNENAADFRRDIVALMNAAYNITNKSEQKVITEDTIAGMIGSQLIVTIKNSESEQYGLSNDVRRFQAVD